LICYFTLFWAIVTTSRRDVSRAPRIQTTRPCTSRHHCISGTTQHTSVHRLVVKMSDCESSLHSGPSASEDELIPLTQSTPTAAKTVKTVCVYLVVTDSYLVARFRVARGSVSPRKPRASVLRRCWRRLQRTSTKRRS
jgi:hypothetical protein